MRKQKKVVIYTRTSTTDPSAANRQVENAMRTARELGLAVAGTYQDHGVADDTSGALGVLLRDADAGLIDTVIVDDLTRLGRRIPTITERLAAAGVEVLTAWE
jgi:DNA invertase Pin-like site-specific DNA recombinase